MGRTPLAQGKARESTGARAGERERKSERPAIPPWIQPAPGALPTHHSLTLQMLACTGWGCNV
eukprot:scaffold37312_cov30-Tisochrysis_lutea.AAC.4